MLHAYAFVPYIHTAPDDARFSTFFLPANLLNWVWCYIFLDLSTVRSKFMSRKRTGFVTVMHMRCQCSPCSCPMCIWFVFFLRRHFHELNQSHHWDLDSECAGLLLSTYARNGWSCSHSAWAVTTGNERVFYKTLSGNFCFWWYSHHLFTYNGASKGKTPGSQVSPQQSAGVGWREGVCNHSRTLCRRCQRHCQGRDSREGTTVDEGLIISSRASSKSPSPLSMWEVLTCGRDLSLGKDRLIWPISP